MAGRVWDKTFEGVTIPLDGVHFKNCIFISCHFKYNGVGEAPIFDDCTFKDVLGVHIIQNARHAEKFFNGLNSLDPSYEGLRSIPHDNDKPPTSHKVARRLNCQ